MAATMDLTAYDAVLKDYYTPDKIAELSFYDCPLYAMMPRKRKGGRRYVQPIEFGNPGNASADFTTAMTNASRSRFEDFLITRVKQYQRVLVDHETLLSSEERDEAFQPAFDEFDRGFRSLGEKVARRLYRTSTGTTGQMNNSSVATTVITLLDPADAFNFQVDDIIRLSATDGAAHRTGSLTVAAVDYEAGTVTTSGNINVGVPAAAVGDFIYPSGDLNLGVAGLESWLPVTNRATNLAASFFGVTRSTNPTRLGGIFLNGTLLGGIDEVLIKLVSKVAKHGGKPSHIFMNPETFADLQLLWNSKNFVFQSFETRMQTGDVIIGFPGMKVNIGGFMIKIFGDRSCPSSRIYCLQMDTWRIWHSGDLPTFLGQEWTGKILKLAENEDSLESRVGCYLNVGCKAPGYNGVAQVTTSI